MITIDQLEILLRTVPQYFLFGGLSMYIFGWIDRKAIYLNIAEIVLLIPGVLALIILLSGMIPAPNAPGLVQEHVEMVIKILTFLSVNSLLAATSLLARLIFKKNWKVLPFIVFAFSIYIFFVSTKMSKVKFELNHPTPVEQNLSETN